MSFAEVVKLVERVSGEERLLCEQTLWNWAQEEKASEVSAALCSEIAAARSVTLPAIDEAVDIYDASCEEVLVMSDAIQLKAQKPTRERAGCTPKRGKKVKRVSAPTFCAPRRSGGLLPLPFGWAGRRGKPLSEVAQTHLKREWGEHPKPLCP